MDKQKGFNLLGVIIAVFIINVGLLSVLSLVSASSKFASFSKNRLIAASLAQEAMETVRSIRDNKDIWSNWYAGMPLVATDYRVQYNSEDLNPDSPSQPLKLDTSTGLYSYDSGSNSIFSRVVTITKLSDDEIKVFVDVKWSERGVFNDFTVEDRLWNWQ